MTVRGSQKGCIAEPCICCPQTSEFSHCSDFERCHMAAQQANDVACSEELV